MVVRQESLAYGLGLTGEASTLYSRSKRPNVATQGVEAGEQVNGWSQYISIPSYVRLSCLTSAHVMRSMTTTASLLLALASLSVDSSAQAPASPLPIPNDMNTVEMNLEGPTRIDALLNYISQRLEVKFEYTPEVGQRSVILRTPSAIPVSSLPALLSSVLRTESLALIDSDIAGWKRVVDVKDMTQFAPTGQAVDVLARDGAAAPVTQVFVLENIPSANLASVLKPFLSQTGSNLISIPDSNVLIVTDYAARVATVADLIEMVDQPGGTAGYEIYEVKHQHSSTLTEQVNGILSEGASAKSGGGKTSGVSLVNEPLSNRIVIAGTAGLVQRAVTLLKQLDVSLGMTTEVYRLKHTHPERIDKLIKGFIEPQDAERAYQATVDEAGNLLIVRATASVHQQVARLIAELDQPVESSESPIQFYKLRNASAIDVLYTLLALQEAYGAAPFQGGVVPAGFVSPFGGAGMPGFGYPGAAYPAGMGTINPLTGGLSGTNAAGMGNAQALQTTRLPLPPGANGAGQNDAFMPDSTNPLARQTLAGGPGDSSMMGRAGSFGGGLTGMAGGAGLGGAGGVASLPGGARVSADISTNSLIVVAPANIQGIYAELIQSLDQRRPQVLIEAKVIAVDTSDDFTLGVEVSIGDRTGATRLFNFTSFGLSEVDATSGALKVIPGLGFNGTLVDPDVADVVVRALSAHRRARVLAAPKILVNDNSTGKLESVSSVPFSSVNASQTVSTTSLGGSQQAGTIITVTPHINEDDHLQLEFDVEFSTFAGAGSSGLPPPRQIDRVGSTVTIPDGKTVVVGGLKRTGEDYNFRGIPWVEHIPVLRELTSRTDRNNTSTSFFLFIRPVVLRDSRFADLRFLSDKEAANYCLPGDYPVSQPELIP